MGEPTTAVSAVTDALATLSTSAGTVIPAALGVAILVFGAKYLWGAAKGLAK